MAPKEEDRSTRRVRLNQVIPERLATGEVKEPDRNRLNVEEVSAKLQEILELKKMETLGSTIGAMAAPAVPARNQSSGEDGLEKLAKVGSLLGIDFTKLQEMRNSEVMSLRKELDDMKKHEIETKIALLDKAVADTNNTMKQFMENANTSRSQGQGLFGVADQVTDNTFTKMAMAKMFGFGGEEKKQEDPMETLIKNIEFSDRVKKLLGIERTEKPAVDPSLVQLGRLDLIKTVLEDDRARAVAADNAKIQEMKINKLGNFLSEIKNYIPDVIEALTSRGNAAANQASNVANDIRRAPPAPKPAPRKPAASQAELPGLQGKKEEPVAEVPAAGQQKVPTPDEFINEEIECPWPDCGKKIAFPTNIPVGYGIKCPYCQRPVEKTADLPAEENKAPADSESKDKPS